MYFILERRNMNSLVGKTIATFETYEGNDETIQLCYFITTITGEIFYLLIIDEYDQFTSFRKTTQIEKEKTISGFNLVKIFPKEIHKKTNLTPILE